MIKGIATLLLGTIGLSTFVGCEVYHPRHRDEVIVEPAGYRVHDHYWDHHGRDYGRHDDRWDHDRY